ncbi:hypothetical protein K2X33_10940 [bacterium]|nr:hypothetical protein [bacterium]
MFKACLGNVNVKRLILATLAVIVFFFVSNFVIHEVMLKSTYEATMTLWRDKPTMESMMIWMLVAQILIAKYGTFIFVKGYEGKGMIEGIRFGIYMGLLTTGYTLIQFVTTPIPGSLAWAWIWTGMVQWIVAGMIAACVYKR